jgi:hypothetical protein
MNRATALRASALVAKRRRECSSNSSVEFQLSLTALHYPTRPIDCLNPSRSQTCSKPRCVFRTRVGAKYDAIYVTSSFSSSSSSSSSYHHRRHPEGALGEVCVVVLSDCESGYATCEQVEDDRKVQLSLAGRDLGQIPALLLVCRVCCEIAIHQVRLGIGGFVGTGEAPKGRFGRAINPWRAMDPATVFSDTCRPASMRSE